MDRRAAVIKGQVPGRHARDYGARYFGNRYAGPSGVQSGLFQGKSANVAHRQVTDPAGPRFINKALHLGDLVTALLLSPDKVAHIIADIAVAARLGLRSARLTHDIGHRVRSVCHLQIRYHSFYAPAGGLKSDEKSL